MSSEHHLYTIGMWAPHIHVGAYLEAAPIKSTVVYVSPRDSDKESTTGAITQTLDNAKDATAERKVLYIVGSFWGKPGVAAMRSWAVENGYTTDETCAVEDQAVAVAQTLLSRSAVDRKTSIVMQRYYNDHVDTLRLFDNHLNGRDINNTSNFLAGIKNLGGVNDKRTDSEKMIDYFEGVTPGCDYESIMAIGRIISDGLQRMALDHSIKTTAFYELPDGRVVAFFSQIPGIARQLHAAVLQQHGASKHDVSVGIHTNPKERRHELSVSSAHKDTDAAQVLAVENDGNGGKTTAHFNQAMEPTEAIHFLKGAKRISP
nr:hypothetical protein [Pandoravirus massiliensis]